MLKEAEPPAAVRLPLLNGMEITVPVHTCKKTDTGAVCTVIKDAGDDPDITHRAEIGVRLHIHGDGAGDIMIRGGIGVGRVTKPGLEVPPGEAAINPGPRQMIREAVEAVLGSDADRPSVTVEVFVPEGERLALKTLNHRLGIIGGISILGTTGLVRPMSHDAYIATIQSSLAVARAAGLETAVFTTGRRSEKHAQSLWPELPEEAFIQIGDFFRDALAGAVEKGFAEIRLAVFFGKAVKMAQGVPHTHAAKSAMTLNRLADWTEKITGDAALARQVRTANTARHAFDLLYPAHPGLVAFVGRRMTEAAEKFGPGLRISGIIFSFDGTIAFNGYSDGS